MGAKEAADDLGDLACVSFKSEMAGVQKMYVRVRQIAFVRLGPSGDEGRITTTPYREEGRLKPAKIC